jgi:succinyl-diaminopimelate desuccinylase
LCIGEKGVLWLKIKAKGRPVHASMAFFGDNAIEKIFKFTTKLHQIEKVDREYNDELEKIISVIKSDAQKSNKFSDEIFKKLVKRLVMNVGMIKGGEKINIVPASAEAIVDIRILPGMTHETVMDEAREILKDSGLEGITFEVVLKANSSYQPLEHPFVDFIKQKVIKEMNMEPVIFLNPGFTDARFFRAKGIPTVIYGCDGQNHHGVDEFITIDNLISTTKAYALAALNFLK